MTEEDTGWNEENSRFFITYANHFIPDRASQIHTLCSLVPGSAQPFRILELACGQGLLAGALLEQFPNSMVIGLDGSHEMLHTARQHLAAFGDRFQTGKLIWPNEGGEKTARPIRQWFHPWLFITWMMPARPSCSAMFMRWLHPAGLS